MVKRLFRSKNEKVLAGICGGVAQYFDIDPVIVRIAAVFLALLSFGVFAFIYLIAWVVVPEGKQ
jgi:phage shock protein C